MSHPPITNPKHQFSPTRPPSPNCHAHRACCNAQCAMRIAIVDESAPRMAIIREGLASIEACEVFVVTERRGLVARISEIAPDIMLLDLGNPSRDVLEEYFAVSRVLPGQLRCLSTGLMAMPSPPQSMLGCRLMSSMACGRIGFGRCSIWRCGGSTPLVDCNRNSMSRARNRQTITRSTGQSGS